MPSFHKKMSQNCAHVLNCTFQILHRGSGERSLWWSQLRNYCLHTLICEGSFPIVLLNYPTKKDS